MGKNDAFDGWLREWGVATTEHHEECPPLGGGLNRNRTTVSGQHQQGVHRQAESVFQPTGIRTRTDTLATELNR